MSSTKAARPELDDMVQDILALKSLSVKENFVTSRAQRDILKKLNSEDLVYVARAIADAEKQQPICKAE
jgi:hypothetical protein